MALHRILPVIAGLALGLAACDQAEVIAPDQGEIPPASAARGNAPVTQHVDVAPLPPLTDPMIDGMAWLTRSNDGIWLEIDELQGAAIQPMDAFTFWAVIFNNPNGCKGTGANAGCGLDDQGRRSAGAMVLNFGGGVDADGDGVLRSDEMTAHLDRLSTAGKQVLVPGPDTPPGQRKGVKNPHKVEVHVIIRNHGPKEADPDDLAEQTSLVGAFCNLFLDARPDRDGVADGCEDQGVAIFIP